MTSNVAKCIKDLMFYRQLGKLRSENTAALCLKMPTGLTRMTKVTFIGLGNMGLPMALNLAKAGHHVRGHDIVPEALRRAAAAGLAVADDSEGALADSDTAITMLPAGADVVAAYRGKLLSAARPGTLFIDCSTIDVASANLAHSLAAAAGMRALDAPVSGGVTGATAATLTFMVGGAAEDVERARPLLEAMGRRIVHCGGPGLGQAAKICNNLILGVSMIAVCEAFVLAERLGLTHQALFDVAAVSSGQCWALTTYCPVPGPVPTSPANQDYRPGFAAALMLKDLNLGQEAAATVGADTVLGRTARDLYRAFAEGGDASRDFSAIVEAIRKGSGQ
jgi:3-hydroxyisobutyrate dehydrogenase